MHHEVFARARLFVIADHAAQGLPVFVVEISQIHPRCSLIDTDTGERSSGMKGFLLKPACRFFSRNPAIGAIRFGLAGHAAGSCKGRLLPMPGIQQPVPAQIIHRLGQRGYGFGFQHHGGACFRQAEPVNTRISPVPSAWWFTRPGVVGVHVLQAGADASI